ncbi:MAG: hypothetical protein US42_C0006G0019 [Candidatus Magasanikbacteria bacterium GW2011_GWC2_37_14]|uniref:Sortilin N-terminal domain-containing protein n=1 Tax=Candidatus Magasanikbacteria bacterium GW2011_GWC2_37_14 TaxID=1619046 RepID=A0A0G0GCM2_9BACT|nr:MAG: hypothetical protein US42_C0006G0019 [Candidatus Magasanikbacteria bacterium GW2011_GWC2_37_14]
MKHKKLFNLGMLTLILFFAGAGCVSLSSNKQTTTGPAGVFVSSDAGESWKQANVMPTAEGVKSIAGVNVYQIVADPQDPDTMYLASRENGLFYTYDGGATWQKSGSPFASGFVYSVTVHPKDKCELYATNGRQIFKTIDCNRSWQEVYREGRSDVLIGALSYNNFPPYQMYMAESNGDFLQSKDGGASWGLLKRFNVRLSFISASPFDGNLLYVISRTDGMYRSEDGGITWVNLKDKLAKFAGGLEYRRHLLHPTDINTIYWVSTYGIMYSHDRGNTWSAYKLITPPGSANIYSFAVNPKDDKQIFYVATINNRSTFYKTLDGGKNWITKKVPSDQLPVLLRYHPTKQNRLYLAFTVLPDASKTQTNTLTNTK